MAIQGAEVIPRETQLRTDVCVVGGGPAGITLALELAKTTSLRIVLIESGGISSTPDVQELNQGTNIGLDYYDLTESRHRMLGGSSHTWAGWCRPMDRLDFDGRSWVADSGWPISYDEFLPFYRSAAQLCELESDQWVPDIGSTLPPLYHTPFAGGDVEIAMWQGSPPTKFGTVYGHELSASEQITTIINATVVEILSDEHGTQAEGVRAATLEGNRFEVRATAIVLSAGALETARLLLASRSATPAGLANENDVVGRYFIEHPHLVTGRIRLFPPDKSQRPSLPAVDRGITGARARLALQRPSGTRKVAYVVGRERQQSDQLLNFSTHLQTVSPIQRTESDAYAAFKLAINNLRSPRRLLRQIRSRSLPAGTAGLAGRLVKGTPEILTIIYHEALRRPQEFALYTQSEQAPNRDSRMTLDQNRSDVLGVPQIKLDWRLSRIDKESVIRSQEIVGQRLEQAGLGRLYPIPPFDDDSPDWGATLRGGHHHLGTARCSTDPTKGVVNPDGEAHTVRNLFIADSSVFPVGGYANPLLTTVAWALRMAEKVGDRYEGRR